MSFKQVSTNLIIFILLLHFCYILYEYTVIFYGENMSDKDKNLSSISQIEKQFGKGTVMKMGDREIVDIPSVSTGSLGLDIALGMGLAKG